MGFRNLQEKLEIIHFPFLLSRSENHKRKFILALNFSKNNEKMAIISALAYKVGFLEKMKPRKVPFEIFGPLRQNVFHNWVKSF